MTSQRGAALILALLFLSFLTVLGGALLTTSTIDAWISDNYKTATQSLYLTEAGIEDAREVLRASAITPAQLLTAAAGADGRFSTSTGLAALLESDDQPLIPQDRSLRITGQPLTDSSGRVIGRYHVWLRNDNADGPAAPADSNQVLALLSFGRIGNALKTIDVTIRKAAFPALPAALVLNGPVEIFEWRDSSIFEIDGDDEGAANQSEPAIGVIESADLSRILAAKVPGDAAEIDSKLPPALKGTAGLEGIVASIAANATDVYNPAFGEAQAIGDFGGATDYRVAVINGDVNLGPGSGYGILLVRGDLTVGGDFSWNGLILVIGQGVLHWNGGSSGSVNGGIFISRTRANDREPANPLGTFQSERGSVTADFRGASGPGIQYNTSTILAANRLFPYVPIAIRER